MKSLSALLAACFLVACGGAGEAGHADESTGDGGAVAGAMEGLTLDELTAPEEPSGAAAPRTDAAIVPLATRRITFDEYRSGTVINTRYAGVTFSKLLKGVEGGNVVVTYRDATSRNTVGFQGLPMFDNRYGTMHVTFGSPQRSVSIDVMLVPGPEGFGQTGIGYMKAYDSRGNLVGTAQTSALNAWRTLTLSAAEIKHAYFTVQYQSYPTYGLFDNLVFSTP